MSKRNMYDGFGFNQKELKQMQGSFGGSSSKGQGLPSLQLNLIDLRPNRVKYKETKARVDKKLEDMRYERKLQTLKEAERTLERERPSSIIGFAKKGINTITRKRWF